ncbi:transglycosylase SLT domain-containing protein [Methyloglobulus sp.]|uniref:transglycosylase SLT domain-containing protein n=1 Tax=Methyloglobulus sp. TaxID=2518622 RepID=UPI003989C98D
MIKKIFFLLTLLISNQAIADIYKFIDSGGRVHYTDEPRSSMYKRIIKTSSYRLKMIKASRFRTREINNNYPTVFQSFSNRFSNRSINKNKFSNLIANAAYRNGVEEKLVHAVIQTESAYNASAVSRAGAVGLMQLMPDTARRYGVTNRTDPIQNVDGGTRYLKDLLDMFNYNLGLAVAAYNAGENAVIKYNNSIPPYPETRNYVRQVLALYRRSL